MNDVGRVTFRSEGAVVVCRWTPEQHTMEGSVFLGSIAKSIAPSDGQVWKDFVDLMRRAFAQAASESTGTTIVCPDEPLPAPEHEKAGTS